jgi:hypothetical protein
MAGFHQKASLAEYAATLSNRTLEDQVAHSYDSEDPWSEFQPLDPAITALVQRLAGYGLLLSEIEGLIKRALEDRLSEVAMVIDGYDESAISVLEGLPPGRKRRH